jgi:hypothetical protein
MIKNKNAMAMMEKNAIVPTVSEDFSVASILIRSIFLETNSLIISTIIFFLKLQKKELKIKFLFNLGRD